jgi:hypothetical protein
MPWIGLTTDPDGGMRACCWNANNKHKYFGPISEFRESDYLRNMKQTLLSGKFPSACSRCANEEASGVVNSRRRRANADFAAFVPGYEDNGFQFLDVRLSNLCNLGCVMCSPTASSYIKNETAKHLDAAPDHFQAHYRQDGDLDLLNPFTEADVDFLIDAVTPTTTLYFAGGEPSLIKKVFRLLSALRDKGLNETVTLHINSNFNKINPLWFDLLKDFKGRMMPSIDGVGARAEWIRYPCVWTEVDHNVREFIRRCPGFEISFLPAVSIMCLFGLKDIYAWSQTLVGDVNVKTVNKLHSPRYFDICNLPPILKDRAKVEIDEIIARHSLPLAEIEHLQDVKAYLDREPNQKCSETVRAFDQIDAMRGGDWRQAMPELSCLGDYP